MVAKKQMNDTTTNEIVVGEDRWLGLDTWEAVVNASPDLQLASVALGDGYTLITKDQLHQSKLEFIILDWTEHMGDKGLFVSVRGITRDNRKFRFTDGSTGVMKQLQEYQRANDGVMKPIHCDCLYRSDYTNADGIDGTTFYLK